MQSSQDDFLTKLLDLEPCLSSSAQKSIRAIRDILNEFPGESLPQIAKQINALVKASRTTVPVIASRAKSLCERQSSETVPTFVDDFRKLSISDLGKVGKKLGIELSGSREEIVDAICEWIESSGRVVPPSARDRELVAAREAALEIKVLMDRVTTDNVDRILTVADKAYKDLKKDGFEEFAKHLGVSVDGTKAIMKKQFKDFVSRLSVTHLQTQF